MVRLDSMTFYANHGCLEIERLEGNTFTVDLQYDYPMQEAAETDDLSKAVDYSRIYDVVKSQMEIPSNLLENVAWRILEAIKVSFPQITSAQVTVAKFNPPLNGRVRSSSVTMKY